MFAHHVVRTLTNPKLVTHNVPSVQTVIVPTRTGCHAMHTNVAMLLASMNLTHAAVSTRMTLCAIFCIGMAILLPMSSGTKKSVMVAYTEAQGFSILVSGSMCVATVDNIPQRLIVIRQTAHWKS